MNVTNRLIALGLMFLINQHAYAEPATAKGLIDKVGGLYSEAELAATIAIASDAQQCIDAQCEENHAFDAKVQDFGLALTQSAYLQYPNLKNEVPAFLFSVAEKEEQALASNKIGHVVIFRGIQEMSLSDQALKFLMAREMAHIIAKHHDKNISTKLLISALTAVAFPAVAILAASKAAADVSTVTSVVSSAASTATSLVGSEVAISQVKPSQLLEADQIAFSLIKDEEIDYIGLSAELALDNAQNSWQKDLLKTHTYLDQLKAEQVKLAEEQYNEKVMFENNANQVTTTTY